MKDKNWRAILVNGLASAVTSRLLWAPLGPIPAMIIGTIVYELDPFQRASVHYEHFKENQNASDD